MRNALWTAKLDSFTLFVLFAEEIKIVYVRNCYLPLVLRKQQEFQKIRRLSSDLPWKPVVPSVSWIPLDSMQCSSTQPECVAKLLYHPDFSGVGCCNHSLDIHKSTGDSSSNRPSFSVSVEL